MKSLSMGDEAGDLAEPRRISTRVKNRNPPVPCWLSLMSAALVTELAASEPPPLHSSIPPPIPLLLFLCLSVSVQLSFTLMYTSFFLFHCLPPCSFSLPISPTVLWSLFISPSIPLIFSVRGSDMLCSVPAYLINTYCVPFSARYSIQLYLVVTSFSPHVAQLNKTTSANCCRSPKSINYIHECLLVITTLSYKHIERKETLHASSEMQILRLTL